MSKKSTKEKTSKSLEDTKKDDGLKKLHHPNQSQVIKRLKQLPKKRVLFQKKL